jgi:hypothetical protein
VVASGPHQDLLDREPRYRAVLAAMEAEPEFAEVPAEPPARIEPSSIEPARIEPARIERAT